MRANTVVRAITAAAALTLSVSGVTAAQTQDEQQTQFPTALGPTLVTAVVTNALDDADTNALIERTAKNYHEAKLGGKATAPKTAKKDSEKQPPRGGFMSFAPFEDTANVTEAVLDLAGGFKPELIVVSGGDWQSNVGIARSNAGTVIIDLNQPEACLGESGQPDPTTECVSDGSGAPGNYSAVEFAVEEGAYLAGVVAARESRGKPLGIISGSRECLECDRYVTGFTNGARSVDSAIEIELAYLANDEVSGFSDEAGAKTFTEAFVDIHQPSVLLPVGRGATMGMVEAACDAGVAVIGAGIDISAKRPDLDNCVMASITADISRAVEEAMFLFSTRGTPSVITFDLARGGVSMTDEWRFAPTKRVDTNDFFAEAENAILTDQVEACPDGCGTFIREPEAEEPAAG